MEQFKCTKKFAGNYNFFVMFWVFIIFSVLGTLVEGIYWIFRYGHFETRSGLIYGPFSEVYGFAVVLMLLLLYHARARSALFLFIEAYIISVSFELFSSFFQQWLFGYTSWDYGTSKFAILGRANLIYAVAWALFGTLLIKKIYPRLECYIKSVHNKTTILITWFVLFFMIFDFTISSAAVYRYDQRQKHIPATNIIQMELDKYYPDSSLEKRFSRIKNGRN